MNEYVVWQKAEIWYKTEVSADSPQHAIEVSQDDSKNTGWDLDLETSVSLDAFEVYDESGVVVLIVNGGE